MKTTTYLTGLLAATALVGSAAPALSDGARVTRGEVAEFADVSRDISGHAQMVRRPSGTTKVTLHLEGLDPSATYQAHVHNQPCSVNKAGGHFQQVPGAGTTPPNEIWPGGEAFTATAGGTATVHATADYWANDTAVSVVLHQVTASGKPKLACADLEDVG